MTAEMQEKKARLKGVELTYRIVGDANKGQWLVCLGGLGGTELVWSHFARDLRDRHRLLIWDYPGLRAGERLDDAVQVEVPALAQYLAALIDAEQIETVCPVGWSLGAQVAVEFARTCPGRINALVTVCGVAGQPFIDDPAGETLRAASNVFGALPQAVGWLSQRLKRIETFRARLRDIEQPTRWAKKIGLVDPVIDERLFDSVIKDFLALDLDTYNRYTVASARHDASDALGTLRFPVLAVAGEQDRFIKPSRIKKMAEAIPDAEYFEIKGATHYLPLEYGPLLALKTDDFLKRKLAK